MNSTSPTLSALQHASSLNAIMENELLLYYFSNLNWQKTLTVVIKVDI